MPFITQGKTNWKFLLIVIVLAILVGGWILLGLTLPIPPPWQPVSLTEQCKEKFMLWCEKCNSYGWPSELDESRLLSGEIKQCLEKYFKIISPETATCGVMKEDCKNFGVGVAEDETTDWKNYSDPEAAFTFKYPTDWEIKTDYQYKSAACRVDPNCEGVHYIFLNKISDSRAANLGEIEKFGIGINMPQCTGVKMDNLPGNNWICVFDENSETLNIYEKIKNSFQLIKDETADWNTYMDRKYKYEVKYPDDWIYLGGLGASIGSFNVKAPVESNNPSDRIESRIFPRKGSESNQEYIDNIIRESVMPGYMDLLSKKEVTFNNIKGYELIWKITDYKTNKTYEGPIDVFFETPSGNKARFIILVFAGEASEDNPNLSIFRRVLTTFNFLGTEETSCENWTKECAGEGEDLCSVCGCKNCCSGLVKREIKYPYSDENNEVSCLEEMTAYTCVKCGDKICSRGEDWCICPEDCKKPKAWEASFKEIALSMVPKAIVCCNAAGSPAIQTVVGAAVCNPTIGKNWPTASTVGTITVNTNCQPDGSFSMTITPGTSNSGTCINAICTQETCTFNGC